MEMILIACTTGTVGGRTAGLVGPDWPWTLLAATPGVVALWEADGPEALGERLAADEDDAPPSGGLWVGTLDVEQDDEADDWEVWGLSYRAPTPAELAVLLARPGSPEASAAREQDRWLVEGRL